MTADTIRDRIDNLYAALPSLECKGLCTDSCGPIAMSVVERDRVREAGTRDLRDDLSCGYLTTAGRCDVYAIRPLICRLWGMVESMRCPHGCEPSHVLTDTEAVGLILAVNRVGGGVAFLDDRSALVASFIRKMQP